MSMKAKKSHVNNFNEDSITLEASDASSLSVLGLTNVRPVIADMLIRSVSGYEAARGKDHHLRRMSAALAPDNPGSGYSGSS